MTGEPPARDPVLADLQRGVRLELLVAPVVVLLPVATAAGLAWQGWVRAEARLLVLAGILAGGNLVFDLLMIQAILGFLREVRDAVRPGDQGDV